ncbi:MAG: DUF3137 domain-containing protein [Candidatus Altiarchaeota archaeon]
MKTAEEFKSLYDGQLLPELKALDARRKKVALGVVALAVAVLAAIAFTIIMLVIGTRFFEAQYSVICCCLGFLPVILCATMWAFGYGRITGGYVSDFKSQIIAKIVRFIDEGLTYESGKTISSSAFVGSRIFLQSPDRFHGEDYVSGNVGKTRMEFSEIHAEYKTETRDSKGHKHTQWHTIFRGLFIIADFNKNFKGLTVVLPDTAEKLFGSVLGKMLQSHNFMRDKLIKLEDPEFEKLFVVYGDDQVEARYILSTSLMQRIMEFRKKTGRNIYLSFVNNNIVVALPYGKNLFEPRIFRSIVDYKQAEEYFENIRLAVEVVEDLNLNTRIWGKD